MMRVALSGKACREHAESASPTSTLTLLLCVQCGRAGRRKGRCPTNWRTLLDIREAHA